MNRHTSRVYKIALGVCNVVLIVVAIIASFLYARNVRSAQEEAKKADFISTVESMKAVSQNYLNSERGYVQNWATYINDREMKLEETLDFLREINTNPERYVHIVDMDTFDAWSAYYPAGEEKIETYHKFVDDPIEWEKKQAAIMWEIFHGTAADFSVLGRYQLQETLSTAVSIGTKVTIHEGGKAKDYLLLRAIPTEILEKTWIFPAEYQSAEVGIITRSGDYVIQAASMKSISFPEYIRGYNFQNDYNEVNHFQQELENSDSGSFFYKNYRGENCLWFYSSFGGDSDLDILGMIQAKELASSDSAWLIVLIICGTLAILVSIDGLYLYHVNVRLRETARLAEEASEAKTQFLSAMSHDIRTPMNAVLGMMSIARQNVENSDYVAQCLDKAMMAGKRLLTLINDVLDISKIESGQFVLVPTEVPLKEFFSELTEMLLPQIRDKKLHFTSNIKQLPAQTVLADQIRLNQIYMNLLSNAVKYTEEGGKINLQVFAEPVPEEEKKLTLVFCVSDNGIGMTQEFQEKMYQSFSRAVNTQVNRTQGSGLGLSIVRQMVDLMGGTITCESEEGKGTTFTVRLELPVVEQETPSREAVGMETDDVSGLHILIAEDNELNWEVIQVLLKNQGVTCERVENGRLCVEKLQEMAPGTYDAIFMDVQMPEMTGTEASRKIRSLPDEERSQIPIIAMTADAFAEDVRNCVSSGMNGHISKPVNVVTLQNYLRKIKNKTV